MKKTEIDKEAQPRRRSPRLAGGVLFVPPQADRRLPRLAGRKLVPPVPPQALTTSNEYYSDADNETDLQRPVQALRAPLVPQVPAPRAPQVQALRDALMRGGLVPPVPPQAPLAPQAPAQVAPQVQAQVAPRIQAPRDALMRGGLVPPVPPQAGEAALEENKSMVELMRNASTRVLNFLNDNQQIFIAASFSVGTLFPLIGIIGMIHKTLVTINVITFVKNNYAAALELIKKHPYRFAAMLVATVALTFFLRSEMWSGKATTTTPPPPPTTTTPPIFSKAPSVNGDFPSVPFAIRDIITGSTPTPVVKYVPTPTPINLFDRYNKTFGMII